MRLNIVEDILYRLVVVLVVLDAFGHLFPLRPDVLIVQDFLYGALQLLVGVFVDRKCKAESGFFDSCACEMENIT